MESELDSALPSAPAGADRAAVHARGSRLDGRPRRVHVPRLLRAGPRQRLAPGTSLRALAQPVAVDRVEQVRLLGVRPERHARAALGRRLRLGARDELHRARRRRPRRRRGRRRRRSPRRPRSRRRSPPARARATPGGRRARARSTPPRRPRRGRTPPAAPRPRRATTEPFGPSGTGSRFIEGEPMKPATKLFAGRSYSTRGVSHCWSRPSRSTATRFPSVIASPWSWVTYTVVTPRRSWSAAMSAPHLHAELRVEVRERLVHEVDARLADDRPAHRDPLALSAGELARLPLQVLGQPEQLGHLAHAPVALRARDVRHLEREGDVRGDGQVRVERVVLEHHRDVAPLRRQVGHVAVADVDGARVDLLEAGEHAQRRRLPGARRADEHHELAVLHVEVERVHRRRRRAGIDARRLDEADVSHGPSSQARARRARRRRRSCGLGGGAELVEPEQRGAEDRRRLGDVQHRARRDLAETGLDRVDEPRVAGLEEPAAEDDVDAVVRRARAGRARRGRARRPRRQAGRGSTRRRDRPRPRRGRRAPARRGGVSAIRPKWIASASSLGEASPKCAGTARSSVVMRAAAVLAAGGCRDGRDAEVLPAAPVAGDRPERGEARVRGRRERRRRS